MSEAICVRCGAWKRQPWHPCRRCKFDPTRDREALVRSVYLSAGRFDSLPERRAYRETLRRMATDIEAGASPSFDETELQRLRTQRDLLRSIPTSAVYATLLRLFLPAILFLAALYGLVLFLKWRLGSRAQHLETEAAPPGKEGAAGREA
jgi:hypothetical protein